MHIPGVGRLYEHCLCSAGGSVADTALTKPAWGLLTAFRALLALSVLAVCTSLQSAATGFRWWQGQLHPAQCWLAALHTLL